MSDYRRWQRPEPPSAPVAPAPTRREEPRDDGAPAERFPAYLPYVHVASPRSRRREENRPPRAADDDDARAETMRLAVRARKERMMRVAREDQRRSTYRALTTRAPLSDLAYMAPPNPPSRAVADDLAAVATRAAAAAAAGVERARFAAAATSASARYDALGLSDTSLARVARAWDERRAAEEEATDDAARRTREEEASGGARDDETATAAATRDPRAADDADAEAAAAAKADAPSSLVEDTARDFELEVEMRAMPYDRRMGPGHGAVAREFERRRLRRERDAAATRCELCDAREPHGAARCAFTLGLVRGAGGERAGGTSLARKLHDARGDAISEIWSRADEDCGFRSREALTSLKLDGKGIDIVPRFGEAGALPNIAELSMCKNSIKRLPAKLDRFLPNLARLRVSRNALEGALSDAVGRLTKLTTLELDGNDLTALPRDLSGLVSLVELNVSKNKLSAFPPSIGKCASLRVVNANDNALTSLPSEFFTGCVALEEFWCRGNRLEALPDALADAAALRKLDVGANALASFPDVAMLQRLEALWASNNALTAPPPGLPGCVSLRLLCLDGNRMRTFGTAAHGIDLCESLRAISARDNGMRTLGREMCRSDELAGSLKELDLRGNELRRLPAAVGRLRALFSCRVFDERDARRGGRERGARDGVGGRFPSPSRVARTRDDDDGDGGGDDYLAADARRLFETLSLPDALDYLEQLDVELEECRDWAPGARERPLADGGARRRRASFGDVSELASAAAATAAASLAKRRRASASASASAKTKISGPAVVPRGPKPTTRDVRKGEELARAMETLRRAPIFDALDDGEISLLVNNGFATRAYAPGAAIESSWGDERDDDGVVVDWRDACRMLIVTRGTVEVSPRRVASRRKGGGSRSLAARVRRAGDVAAHGVSCGGDARETRVARVGGAVGAMSMLTGAPEPADRRAGSEEPLEVVVLTARAMDFALVNSRRARDVVARAISLAKLVDASASADVDAVVRSIGERAVARVTARLAASMDAHFGRRATAAGIGDSSVAAHRDGATLWALARTIIACDRWARALSRVDVFRSLTFAERRVALRAGRPTVKRYVLGRRVYAEGDAARGGGGDDDDDDASSCLFVLLSGSLSVYADTAPTPPLDVVNRARRDVLLESSRLSYAGGKTTLGSRSKAPSPRAPAAPARVKIGTISPGGVFGEETALAGKPRAYTVVCAEEDATALAIPSRAFVEVVRARPSLADVFARLTAWRRAEVEAEATAAAAAAAAAAEGGAARKRVGVTVTPPSVAEIVALGDRVAAFAGLRG